MFKNKYNMTLLIAILLNFSNQLIGLNGRLVKGDITFKTFVLISLNLGFGFLSCFFFSLSDLISPLKPTIYINILEFYKSNYYFHLFKSYFYFYVPQFFMSIKKPLSLLCFGSFLICFIEINYYKNNYIHSQMINQIIKF